MRHVWLWKKFSNRWQWGIETIIIWRRLSVASHKKVSVISRELSEKSTFFFIPVREYFFFVVSIVGSILSVCKLGINRSIEIAYYPLPGYSIDISIVFMEIASPSLVHGKRWSQIWNVHTECKTHHIWQAGIFFSPLLIILCNMRLIQIWTTCWRHRSGD